MSDRRAQTPAATQMTVIFLLFGFVPLAAQADADVKQIVGHRGACAVAPENTLASLRAAIDAGATAVEVDVRTTKDGHLVLSHDERLDRATDGEGRIGDKTLAEIKKLDAGSWFNARFAGELGQMQCFFRNCGELTLLHSKDPGLLAPILAGNAFFTRLEGEWWMRFLGA